MPCELFTSEKCVGQILCLKSVGINAAVINDNLDVNSHVNLSSYEIQDRFSYASQKLSCIPATPISDKGWSEFESELFSNCPIVAVNHNLW